MYRSWKDYSIRHRGNKNLNDSAALLHTIFKNAVVPEQCFIELSKHPTLVCLSRAPFLDEIQATHHHDSVTSSVAQTKAYHYGLVGFGQQANAVRIDVEKHFIQSSTNVKIPAYDDLIDCTTKDEIIAVVGSDKKEKLDSYVVLPPVLASEIFEEEDWDAANIFLKFVKKIKKIRKVHDQNVEDIEEELENVSLDDDDIGNIEVETDENDEERDDEPIKEVLSGHTFSLGHCGQGQSSS